MTIPISTFARRLALLLALFMPLLSAHAASAANPVAIDLPGDSVYQLDLVLTGQDGRSQPWGHQRGQPMLVSMFYTSCQYVCPMLIEALADTRAKLSPEDRARLPVTIVSFDPARDSVAALQRTAEQRRLDPAVWTLARTDARSVRRLAAALGIQYRALPDGEFNHSTVLLLLDADGRIAARSNRLGSADPAFVQAATRLLQATSR
ncbi:SCO family protein [Leptothrix sp. BB-4]